MLDIVILLRNGEVASFSEVGLPQFEGAYSDLRDTIGRESTEETKFYFHYQHAGLTKVAEHIWMNAEYMMEMLRPGA